MIENNILNSLSFATLDADGQKAVRDLFDVSYKGEKKLSLRHVCLFRNRQSLASTLSIYNDRLDKTHEATFSLLKLSEVTALEEELLLTFYYLSAQYQLDAVEKRRHTLVGLEARISRCAQLIDGLRLEKNKRTNERKPDDEIEEAHYQRIDDSPKALRYAGWKMVSPLIVETMVGLVDSRESEEPVNIKSGIHAGALKSFIDRMSEVNLRRLFMIWVDEFVLRTVQILPNQIEDIKMAEGKLAAPAPVMGYISWILYYFRFGVSLGLFLKHWMAGPWMHEAEKNIPQWERFKTQWQQRKFSMINDSIWASANLACFYWLLGKGTLGYLGNVATVLLLFLDLTLTVWRFVEEETEHDNALLKFGQELRKLDAEIRKRTAELQNLPENDANKKQIDAIRQAIETLQLHREKLKESQEACVRNYRYKKWATVNDLIYTASLLIAFGFISGYFFPPALIAQSASHILMMVGASLCLFATALNAWTNSAIDITKFKNGKGLAKIEYQRAWQKFQDTHDVSLKKLYYLDMKRLESENAYHDRLIRFQQLKLCRRMFVDTLLPALTFVSVMFLPLQIGLPILATSIALAVFTRYLLRYANEPQRKALPDLEEDFNPNQVRPNPDLLPSPSSGKHGIFGRSKRDNNDLHPNVPYEPLNEDDREGEGYKG